jgi:tetratricopeptide (TPR) repeat protein
VADLEEAKRLYDKGLDDYRAGEYEQALEAFSRARDLYAAAGDRKSEADVVNDMGVVHIQSEEWDNAQRFLDEALTIRLALQDRLGQGITLGNIGMMYERQDQFDKATDAYQQAMDIFQELGETGNEKAIAAKMNMLRIKSGAQKLVRRFSHSAGRLLGGSAEEPPAEEEIDEE